MEIKTNDYQDTRKESEEQKVMESLNKDGYYYGYRTVPLIIAKEICRDFVNAGYHAKINYFCDGRASYQCFVISKAVLNDTAARMVYSEMYG